MDEFYIHDIGKRDTRRAECKECTRKRSIAYRATHHEQVRVANLRYYATHKDELAEYQARYNETHIDAVRKWGRRKQRRYFAAHREEVCRRAREYKAAHKEVSREQCARRRAAKRGASISVGDKEAIKRIYDRAANGTRVRCYLCGKIIPKGQRHVDHVIPLSKGGLHAASNLDIACARCNLKKWAKLPEEIGMLTLVVA